MATPIGGPPPPYTIQDRERDKKSVLRLDVAIAETHYVNTRLIEKHIPDWVTFLTGSLKDKILSTITVLATLTGVGAELHIAKIISEALQIAKLRKSIIDEFVKSRTVLRRDKLPNAGGGKYRRVVRSRNPS